MKKPYKIASYAPLSAGFALLLDGRPAQTPMGRPFVMPSAQLAEVVAHEWQSQGETLRKGTMPLTQFAIIAIDALASETELLSYGETDLTCYRAPDETLAARQAVAFDPLLEWAEARYGVTFTVTGGVMPVKQPAGSRQKLASVFATLGVWKLAALTAAVRSLGSLVLALAMLEWLIDAEEAFRLAHLEEEYATEKWGRDEEKESRLRGLKAEVETARRFGELLG